MTAVQIRLWLALAAVVGGLAACANGTPDGAVTGTLLVSGGPAPGTPRPLPGEVRLLNISSGVQITGRVGVDGRYQISVLPGRYRLSCVSPQMAGGSVAGTGAAIDVEVVASKVTKADCGWSIP
jgi:hypothetical protein